jgi:hypothetical protein
MNQFLLGCLPFAHPTTPPSSVWVCDVVGKIERIIYLYAVHIKQQLTNSQIFTMNHKKSNVERCVFCNSASHHMTRCNSNMNGRRELLDKRWNCMMHDLCPDFKLLRANELRYIAYHYAQYLTVVHDPTQRTTRHYNRKYMLRPIPLDYSKKKMINELVYRWHAFRKQRDLAKNPPENSEDDECPICYDTMKSCKWSYPTSSWEINRDDVITTECNHTYCTRCWNEHLEKSSRWTHYSTRRYVSCPMCRHEIPADP